MAVVATASRTPVQAFHDLVFENEADAVAQFDALEAGLLARGLLYGGRPVPTSLRPRILTEDEARIVRRDSRAIWATCDALERFALSHPALLQFLHLPEDELEVIRYDSAYAPTASFSRLDGFLQPDRVVFVEFNVDSPGGAAFTDAAAEVFLTLPIMQRFQERYRIANTQSGKRILNVLLESYRRFGGPASPPQIAIVDWEDVSTATEFRLLQAYFEKRGIPTRVVDPRHLSYRRGSLYFEAFRIDIAYKRVVTRELLDRRQDCGDFLRACKDGAVCLVNPFRAKIQTVKAVMAALWSPRFESFFSKQQLQAVHRCIPWTAKVERTQTTRPGRSVDLIEYILEHQASLVLKPNDEYGGTGVTLGWTVDRPTWEQRLQDALTAPYVVQERVDLPREPFPIRHGDRIELQDFYVDCDPYFFEERMGTIGTRFSSAAVLNVKTGGGVVPTFVVQPAR